MQEKIRVVLADDHVFVRKAFITLLSGFPEIEVVGDASNGRELLDRVALLAIKPHVALLDLKMPVMDGFDTFQALRDHYPDMKLIILTQYEDENVLIRMLRAGADGYFVKDTEPDILRKAIIESLNDTYVGDKRVKRYVRELLSTGKIDEKQLLTEKEKQFLRLCCSELSYKEIASLMIISADGANYYRKSLCCKLDVSSRTGLAMKAIEMRLVLPGDQL
jgi:DNA-binding NarL/FixJ family response regulator